MIPLLSAERLPTPTRTLRPQRNGVTDSSLTHTATVLVFYPTLRMEIVWKELLIDDATAALVGAVAIIHAADMENACVVYYLASAVPPVIRGVRRLAATEVYGPLRC